MQTATANKSNSITNKNWIRFQLAFVQLRSCENSILLVRLCQVGELFFYILSISMPSLVLPLLLVKCRCVNKMLLSLKFKLIDYSLKLCSWKKKINNFFAAPSKLTKFN